MDAKAGAGPTNRGALCRGRVEFIASERRTEQVVAEIMAAAGVEVRRLPVMHGAGGGSTPDPTVVCSLNGPAVALDCEGVRLGRFGRVCVVQVAAPGDRLFLLDALRPGVVAALAPLLESPKIAKAMHDCREDSAALYHQHGIFLRSVFDTQVANAVYERRAGRVPHQVSASELLRTHLGCEDPPELIEVKQLMQEDNRIWARRPLGGLLVRYALSGISELLALRRAIILDGHKRSRDTGAAIMDVEMANAVAQACDRAVRYCFLNSEFPSAQSMAKIGTRLWGMVTARNDTGVYLKLNAGRIGLVSTASALNRFRGLQLGDLVLCCVSGLSLDGSYLYLDHYDEDWDYFDHQLRPSGHEQEVGAFGRERRHRTSLFVEHAGCSADPLLVRGLPAADDLVGAEGMDVWEAGPEDVGLPTDIEY